MPHKSAASPAEQPRGHHHMSCELSTSAEFLPHLDVTSAHRCDRWLCYESRWIKNYTQSVFCGFPSVTVYSGLAGVDCGVVCPLMEPICLWGWCSKLSKVLSVTRVDFCKHEHSFHSYILNHSNTCDLAARRLFKVLFQNDGFHIWISKRKRNLWQKSFAGWFTQINVFFFVCYTLK